MDVHSDAANLHQLYTIETTREEMRKKSGLGPGQVFAMRKRDGREIGRFGLEILA